MRRSTKIITAIILIVGSSSAVYAFTKQGPWQMTPEEKVEFVTDRVTQKLDLDSQQQQNFTSLAETIAQIVIDAKASKEQQVGEINALLQEPSFNQARALELVQQKTQMINEKAPLVVASLAVFLDSLNTEQKQQLQEFIEHHRKHRHHGHGDHK